MLTADRHTRLLRARRSLDGLSVGDAFGERFFAPPGTWAWTDDTAMAISLVETLARHDSVAVAGAVFGGTGSMAYFADDLDRVVVEAVRSAKPTHAHPREGAGGRDVLLREVLARTPAGETAKGIGRRPS